MVHGERWNWKCDTKNKLIYLGKKGVWHQFALVEKPHEVWCEVLDEDLRLLEKTKAVSA